MHKITEKASCAAAAAEPEAVAEAADDEGGERAALTGTAEGARVAPVGGRWVAICAVASGARWAQAKRG